MRIALDNRSSDRVLPGLWLAGDEMNDMIGKRRPFLTAKRLLTNQTFRDLYRTDTLDIDQRLKITSLTFLFTDLKGSTDLYERVGDLVAFDLVQTHFMVLQRYRGRGIGRRGQDDRRCSHGDVSDSRPRRCGGVAHARGDGRAQPQGQHRDLLLKIGIHEGPCLAVNLNERQDYFGQTVNIASRVQGLAGDALDPDDGAGRPASRGCGDPAGRRIEARLPSNARCAAWRARWRSTKFPDESRRRPGYHPGMNDKLIGRSVPRLEDFRFLTGRGRYVADIAVPGALWGHVLRSPHAHAVIKRIDTAAAARAPGRARRLHVGRPAGLGAMPCMAAVSPLTVPPRFALAVERVRHVGDPVAFIVADSAETAREAAELVEIDYEALPSVVDGRAAIAGRRAAALAAGARTTPRSTSRKAMPPPWRRR